MGPGSAESFVGVSWEGGGGLSSAMVTVVEHSGDSKASGSGRMNRLHKKTKRRSQVNRL